MDRALNSDVKLKKRVGERMSSPPPREVDDANVELEQDAGRPERDAGEPSTTTSGNYSASEPGFSYVIDNTNLLCRHNREKRRVTFDPIFDKELKVISKVSCQKRNRAQPLLTFRSAHETGS